MSRLKVKAVAQQRGYNIKTLSEATGIPYFTIWKIWSNPDHNANVRTLDRIATALGVSTSDLLANGDHQD